MSKNIMILGVNPSSGNRGVGALAYSTIYLLEKLSEEFPEPFNLYIVEDSLTCKKRKDSFNIGGRNIDVTIFPFAVGRGIRGFLKVSLSLLKSFSIVKNTTHVLDMGQGDSFSDIYGKERFDAINIPKRVLRVLGKKQLLLPQTIGPFRDATVSKEANKSIEKAKVVFARDKMSYDYVIQHTKQKNIHELIDVAFFMPYTKGHIDNTYVNVGLNISSLMWYGGYTKNNQFGFNIEYKNIIKRVIEYFISQPNLKLHLVPHVVVGYSHVENDYEISRIIQNEYSTSNIILAPFFLDPIDAKNYISGLDFFMGARMHACIAAFSTGVPVYPMAYSRKFNGLFVETLNYPFIGDLVNQSEEDFFDGIIESFENRLQLKKQIEERLNGVVEERGKILMEKLKSFLES